MISAQFNVDIVGELKHILPSCKLTIPSAVLKELGRIKNRSKGKDRIAASIALKIASSPPFELMDVELLTGETVDDSLLRLSEKSRILCTNDRELKTGHEKRILMLFICVKENIWMLMVI